ncbi:XRE family transcriptional regulator [Segetibacter sp. 3557_3]|uniref:helix-turn-helix domain-containing protein n=1 Tax=Segetibacter sp. 3557_3 TaxID=2547429 RepID=UPI001058D0A5|nr:helix-turn-helix transcriptional regulator [Segetibacter sp. 3557_3]TDH18465.1 XRE family transcriptional regulator [Segetibacter sp. 3557_3]
MKAVEEIFKEHYHNITECEIAQKIGFTHSNYSRLKSVVKNYPTVDNCAIICEVYHISEAWLLSGKGPMRLNQKPKPQWTAEDHLKEALRLVQTEK